MKPADKHYKFINSKTGYVIYYHSISSELPIEEIAIELQQIKTKVAVQNSIYIGTVYWEEIKGDDD